MARELVIWLALLAVYVGLTSIDWTGRHQLAVANSRSLYDLERSLNIDIEPALNNWLVSRDVLRVAANYEYALTYLISSFGLIVWLYLRRPATYRWARTSFIVLNVASLICFAVYPVAPPRLVADLGFTDTVVLDRTWGSWGSPLVSHANQLAAMPSLHIGWALWVSVILATIASGWVSQTVSGVHVLLTLLVIMATANHYLIDAFGGALVAVAAVAVTRPGVNTARAPWFTAIAELRRRIRPGVATRVAELRRHGHDQPSLRLRPRLVHHTDPDSPWRGSEHRPPSLGSDLGRHWPAHTRSRSSMPTAARSSRMSR